MIGKRLSSVKNPKRQFSRRRRRHHRVADPDDIMLVSRPRGFFPQYKRQLGQYAAAVAIITVLFAKGSPVFAVAFCVLSLFIPMLWVVQYKRSKKRLELFESNDHQADEVVHKLS